MTGGASGVQGATYQQLYVAFRLLATIAAKRLETYRAHALVDSFKIEGRTDDDGGPIWDVHLVLESGEIHLRECKDTAITAPDRRVFYRRIRSELANGTLVERLTAGWVTDPDKQQGRIIAHLRGMACFLNSRPAVPEVAPGDVRSADDALNEALYYLCSPTETVVGESSIAPCSIDAAYEVIRRIRVEEFRLADLLLSVQLLASEVFESGTGETIATYICGTFSTQIAVEHEVAQSLEQFLQSAKVGAFALSADGPLRDLMQKVCASGPAVADQSQGVHWIRLDGEPKKVWPLAERLPGHRSRSCFVTAPIGTGKTITSYQALLDECTRRDPHHVLRVDAKLLDEGEIKELRRLLTILCGISPSWIIVDGMDDVERDLQKAWLGLVDFATKLPGVTLVVTARSTVVLGNQWLQELELRMAPCVLDPLTPNQVKAEFERVDLPVPQNARLIARLQTPLLFALYARIAEKNDLPFFGSGEVDEFRIIQTFWQKTVTTESTGLRIVGLAHESLAAKLKAAREFVEQSLKGGSNLSVSDDAQIRNGAEMLLREGVVRRPTSFSYQWIHDSLEEFAMIDVVVSKLDTMKESQLADAICVVPIEHVGRVLAVAGLKWTLANPEHWTPQAYFLEIWSRNPGYGRYVMGILVEGDPGHLDLQSLSHDVLIEFFTQARLVRAKQWLPQVTALPATILDGAEGARLHAAITEYELEFQ